MTKVLGYINILTLMFLVKGSKNITHGTCTQSDVSRLNPGASDEVRRGKVGTGREQTQELIPSHRPAGQRRHTNRFAHTELSGRSQSSLGFI